MEQDPSTDGVMRLKVYFDLLLKGINRMDQLVDPDFDPSEDLGSWPVPLPDGVYNLRPGCDPLEIKDPSLRKEYERAIEVALARIERHKIQSSLVSLIDSWMHSVQVVSNNWHITDPEGFREAEPLVNELIDSPLRRKQLRKTIANLPKSVGEDGRSVDAVSNVPSALVINSPRILSTQAHGSDTNSGRNLRSEIPTETSKKSSYIWVWISLILAIVVCLRVCIRR